MKSILRRLITALASAGAALLLMGASNNNATPSVTSSLTSSITGSVTSKPTTSVVSRATGSVTSSATTSVINRGAGAPVMLSPYAEEVARIIKFDRQVLVIVKAETQEHIQRLIGYDENDYQIMAPGIVVSVPRDKTDRVLASLRLKLTPLNYMPFIVEMNAALRTDKIGVIKGPDQHEILRIMHTDGDDYDISHQDVIDRLKEWEKCCPFVIIGAGSNWVELEFKTLPRDLRAFVEEVNDFSPDAVEQGPGSIAELIKEIKRTNRLFLIWE